jgi:hypothetical protein
MNGREQRLRDTLDRIWSELKRVEGVDRVLSPLEHESAEKLRAAVQLIASALQMLGDDDTDDW